MLSTEAFSPARPLPSHTRKRPTQRLQPPARGSKNPDQLRAASETPLGPAPLPAATRSPPRPSPPAPPARPSVPCGRTSTSSSFPPLASERGGVASGQPENGSAPQPAGSPPPAPATSRSSCGSFRCFRGRPRRLGRRGRAGKGGAARRARPAAGAWLWRPDPGKEPQAYPHLQIC